MAVLYPWIAVGIKRCHDRNRTGWFLLIGLIPLVSIWLVVELGFLRGTVGQNRFGPDPLAGSTEYSELNTDFRAGYSPLQ